MLIFLKIFFLICCMALLHSYVFFPVFMRWRAQRQLQNWQFFKENDDDLPNISVIMSVYNEEKVIEEKLKTLVELQYPISKIQIFIGSDCSDDATNAICRAFSVRHPHFHFIEFQERRGKPSVVNDLVARAFDFFPKNAEHVLLLTDASVMLQPDTIFKLARHFKNKKIGVVDAHIVPAGLQNEGISRSENQYLSAEVLLKHYESKAWGMMMGPFGGCYALRSDLFEAVPPHHLVDDFYLTFRVLERGFWAVNDLEARCTEGAVHRVQDEYRRKKRIAAGSFQNLWVFRKWVLPPNTKLGFTFFSHKVLRWLGGFLMLGMGVSAGILAFDSEVYRWIFWVLLLGGAGVPLLDYLFNKLKINFLPLRSLAYFVAMNLALVEGFFKFTRGIRSGTWQRTPRT